MKTLSILMPDELHDIIKQRAAYNKRSVTGELNVLIETALACASEATRETMRFLYRGMDPEGQKLSTGD